MDSSSNTFSEIHELLSITNPDRGFQTCVGFAPSKGRRCWNPINAANRVTISKSIHSLARGDCAERDARHELERIAELALCVRYHRNQSSTIAARWMVILRDAGVQLRYPPSLRQSQRSNDTPQRAERVQARRPSPASVALLSIPRPVPSPRPAAALTSRAASIAGPTPSPGIQTNTIRISGRAQRVGIVAPQPATPRRASTLRSPSAGPASTVSVVASVQNRQTPDTVPSREVSPSSRVDSEEQTSTTGSTAVNTPPSLREPSPVSRTSTSLSNTGTPSLNSTASSRPSSADNITPRSCGLDHVDRRQLTRTSECSICFLPLQSQPSGTLTAQGPAYLFCKKQCGQTFHRACIMDWIAEQQESGRTPKCCICRRRWMFRECSCDDIPLFPTPEAVPQSTPEASPASARAETSESASMQPSGPALTLTLVARPQHADESTATAGQQQERSVYVDVSTLVNRGEPAVMQGREGEVHRELEIPGRNGAEEAQGESAERREVGEAAGQRRLRPRRSFLQVRLVVNEPIPEVPSLEELSRMW